jgi:hypothetical protein
METRYLYRGTRVGWPGNPTLRDRRTTCTTAHPLVATLFAIECRNHGAAAILAARRDSMEGRIAAANDFDIIECAVNVQCSPAEFEREAEFLLDVDAALEILRELGFADMTTRLNGKSMLHQELEETHALGMRLNEVQIRRFNARMQEVASGRENP